ncbi:dipeptidase [Spirosoma sp. HMF4905]|uniref:Dipeptidase n=1 Tax=Spirosoma arboris TaxID=2682092 RepID=A0A7K1S5C9_9BACT|nr:dipeptidase [Spirosoma arboris]
MTRRDVIKSSVAATASVLGMPMINKGWFRLFAHSPQQYSERAIRLVEESTVIDLLNQFRGYLKTPAELGNRWLSKPGAFTEADARTYLESGINVFALGHGAKDYETGLQFFARWNGFIAGYPQWLLRIDSAKSLDQINTTHKIGILLSLQTSSHFRSPDDVDTFLGLGQRISQLTYSEANLIGSGFFEPRDGGLTDFGVSIVERMNKVGMGIDISHCGDQTTLDALELSKQPVLITHAGCRALVPKSARAKTDEMIRKLAAKGGVMGIPFLRFMVHDQEPVTIEHLLNHFDHVARLVGVEHVGMGSDQALDTDDEYPEENKAVVAHIKGLDKRDRYSLHLSDKGQIGIEAVDHPKRVYDLTEGLIRRKYSDANIRLMLGENAKRILTTIWSV